MKRMPENACGRGRFRLSAPEGRFNAFHMRDIYVQKIAYVSIYYHEMLINRMNSSISGGIALNRQFFAGIAHQTGCNLPQWYHLVEACHGG